ncbi:MAG: mechanosensitive ion channel [bacterium]|nr:mechanosensitive ion channel [bacterium]
MPELTPEMTSQIVAYGVKGLGAVALLIVVWIAGGWARRAVNRGLARSSFDPTLGKFFANMARWVVIIAGLLGVLGYFGIETTSFAAIFAGAGLAIGMALSGTLGNFASGIMLLVFRPFEVGHVIRASGEIGKVFEIGLFNTTLDTPDNRRIIMPNGIVAGGTIENVSHHETRRVDVAVGTDYTADLDRTRQVLEQAARALSQRLPDEDPAIVLSELGGSSIDWVVRVWVKADDYWPAKDALTRAVKVALDDAKIGIPFPQMDVHVDQVS